ncbi:DUF934 domain-containing protein [Teredinibacter purpureus]|uniref:DUF934 domain-containing protein n=1 Tax=Teredinibacter purpureus TaxID=2731756 RepID=UPI0005F7D0AD|nr:DUF934 domain-containing protein [Teredinibacter purpureus]
MPKLIKNGEVTENPWVTLTSEEVVGANLASGQWLIPLSDYLTFVEKKSAELANCSPWISTDFDLSSPHLEIALQHASLIGIEFPAFTDGRGFSLARTIRELHEFKGDLRAVGNFIADQMFFLSRCGISSFAVNDDISTNTAQECLADFSVRYQAGIDEPQPLFRRRS